MNQIHSTLRQLCLLIVIATLSLSVNLHAAGPSTIQTEGKILELTRSTINVSDLFFRIIPTVKVKIPGKNKASLSDLKVGNFVRIELQKYNGKLFVDSILLLPRLPDNEELI